MTLLRTSPGRAGAAFPDAPPQAARARPAGWRDPRLVVGVVIVAVCVLLGARVLAAADDTVAVWSLRHDVPSGAVLQRTDLAVARVHFTGTGADRYLPASAEPASGSVALHDLSAGELLPRSAVGDGGDRALVEVPLSVAPDDLPASVVRGATVDVWVTPSGSTSGSTPDDRARARLALEHVVVVAVPERGDSLAPQTTRQVIVGVDRADADALADALGQLADGRVVVTRQAGP
jgi:hypothetical protein